MNAPQINAVPTAGKATGSGAGSGVSPASESLPSEGGESFAKHLKQLDQSQPPASKQTPQNTAAEKPQATPSKTHTAQELRDIAQFRGDAMPEAVLPLATGLAEDGEPGVVAGEYQQAVLQQLAERLQAGEEVVVSSTQPQVSTDALPVAGEGAEQQILLTSASVPAVGTNLPQSGDPLPPVASDMARQAVSKPLPQAVEPGLNRAALASQQELPAKVGLELPANTLQPEKALADAGRFSAILGSAAESTAQSAGGGNSSLTASVASLVSGAQTLGSTEANAARPVVSLNTPLGEPGWAQEVGSRLQVMVERGNQRAEIRLNPPELGSIEVRLNNDGERTNVTFFAQNATTREALEAALPRLREMFGENGLQLADANVSQQQTMAGGKESGEHSRGGEFSVADMGPEDVTETTVTRTVNGLVDTYI
ncbi:flagellar hook-length control protein FliK [Porticoccus sp. W117]|uniref:flagellar hook-length control protein FliK n=1 Tax=Porticoccus sp. W117 TaxID=3054777 RepID=UPI002597AD5F|nr:flagellar hook-length control protein FliK [Porticoccus sp. W117]MDM3870986.1 flagellar hook-length control protein FliK [Porticoccus sp. W117]